MELRAYAEILWRRSWIIALMVGVAIIYIAYAYYASHSAIAARYQSSVTIRIGFRASSKNTDMNYATYVAANDELADAFTTGPVLNTDTFATQISQQIQSDSGLIAQRFGSNAQLGDWQNTTDILSALTATRSHNLVLISVDWNTSAGSWAIANAIGEVSSVHISTYLDYEVRDPAASTQSNATNPLIAAQVVTPATQPIDIADSILKKTTLLLVFVVALIVGIALALLIDYLDDRIRRSEEVADLLQLPIYGELPPAPATGQTRLPSTTAAS